MVGGAAGCRLFDRDSAWSGRDQFHRGPLSPDHAIGERGIVAQLCLQNPPRIDRLIDVGALRTNRAYYWLSLSLVSFVTAGLREELWRGHAGGNARPLAGRIYVPHRREHCHRLNRGRVWRCSFADGPVYSTQPLLRCCHSSQTSSRSCVPRRTTVALSAALAAAPDSCSVVRSRAAVDWPDENPPGC